MSDPPTSAGVLTVVATPIGNLGDLSPRAVEALSAAGAIACEDTRRTGRLLQHAAIAGRPFIVVNEHTEAHAAIEVVALLRAGVGVALVSDAGMPGISDPGELVVRAALAAGIAVAIVPGPSAALTGLVLSGLPSGRFVFEGFLPRKGSGRGRRLTALAGEDRTMVLYEAPHRLARTLADLADALGPARPCAVARELTKLHEEVWRGSLAEAVAMAGEKAPRGEYVLVIEGKPPAPDADDEAILAALADERAAGASTKDAVAAVASRLGVAHRRVYELATH